MGDISIVTSDPERTAADILSRLVFRTARDLPGAFVADGIDGLDELPKAAPVSDGRSASALTSARGQLAGIRARTEKRVNDDAAGRYLHYMAWYERDCALIKLLDTRLPELFDLVRRWRPQHQSLKILMGLEAARARIILVLCEFQSYRDGLPTPVEPEKLSGEEVRALAIAEVEAKIAGLVPKITGEQQAIQDEYDLLAALVRSLEVDILPTA